MRYRFSAATLWSSRDMIIHKSGRINKLYVEKAGDQGARGADGEDLTSDPVYFRQVIVTLKSRSGEIQSKT